MELTKQVDIWTLLKKRFPSNEYALLPEVRNAAGHYASRSADGIAFNLWPSRGLAIEGIEIKSYRSDWLSELKKPEKAEAIFKYCDYWWLVTTNDKVAKIEEIPETWGWMCANGGKLITMKPAPKLTPVAIEKGIVASMLKRATQGMIPASTIADRLKEEFEKGRGSVDNKSARLRKELEDLQECVRVFEEASGVSIPCWGQGNIGKVVNFYLRNGNERFIKDVENLRERASKILENTQEFVTTPEEVNERLKNS